MINLLSGSMRRLADRSIGCVIGALLVVAVIVAAIRLGASDPLIRNGARTIFLLLAMGAIVVYGVSRWRYPTVGATSGFGLMAAMLGFVLWLVSLARCAFFGPSEVKGRVKGRSFSFSRRSNYSAVAMFSALGLVLEMPVLHILISAANSIPSDAKPAIHVYLITVSALGLLLLLGDYRQIRQTSHEVFDDHMRVQLGARCVGNIPIAYIDDISVLTRGQSRVLFGGCKRRSSSVSISLADLPNVLLRLNSPCLLFRLGAPCMVVSLGIFVDEPDQFMHALSRGAAVTRRQD